MKAYSLLIFLLLITGICNAQKITISGFTIKRELPGDVSLWKVGDVNAVAKSSDPQGGEKEVRMVIQIKRGSGKVCGNDVQSASYENVSTKVISVRDVQAALGDCPQLPPGQYRLCIQFFNIDKYDLSGEQCRDFTVAEPVNQENPIVTTNPGNPANPGNPSNPRTPGTTVTPGTQAPKIYRRPDLIAPARDTKLKDADLRKPLTLRWTPVVPPPPNNDILYTVRIVELKGSQSEEVAMRANQPIFEKEVKTTQTTWQIPTEYTSSKETIRFAWSVQATNNEGKGYGDHGGMSETWGFSLRSGGNDMHSTIDTLECTDKPGEYKLTITYRNDESHTNTITQLTPVSSVPTSAMTVLSSNPVIPFNLTGGNTVTIEYIISTAGVSISELKTRTNYENPADPANDAGMFADTTYVKPCICTYCDDKKPKLSNVTASVINNASGFDELEINADLFYGTTAGANVPVYRITAEIVGFEHTMNSNLCTVCNTANEMHGVFVNPNNNVFVPAGSWLNTGKAVLYSPPANFSRQAEWSSSSGVNMATAAQHVKMRVGVPGQNDLQCCNDKIRLAVRFSFVSKDENGECRICEIVRSACIVRNGKECPKNLACPDTPHGDGTLDNGTNTPRNK